MYYSYLQRFPIIVLLLLVFVCLCASENVKKSIDDNRDDTSDSNDESLDIPIESEINNLTCTRRVNSQMHEIRNAKERQYPFVAAVMSQQNEYLCSGSVISNGMVLTTAKCTQQPVSYVLLNTTSDKKEEHAAMLHVIKIEKFPTFTGGESLKDVAILYIEKPKSAVASKIKLSNLTTISNVVDLEAVGFGLNTEVGQPRELQYVGLESRSDNSIDLITVYFDCVETKVPTCFKDTGSPIIFDNELIGIVTKGQEDCTKEISATYAINKKMADVLPIYTFKAWLDEKIKKNEETESVSLPTFPSKPALRQAAIHQMTGTISHGYLKSTPTYMFPVFCLVLAVY